MACKTNEIAILKAASVKLDDETMMLLTYMYHTPEKEARKSGEKSFYRYEGRVMKIADFKAEIAELKSDERSLQPWVWPTKSEWWKPEYFLGYDAENNNAKAAKWYQLRINKMVDWPTFLKMAKEGIKMTAKGPKTYPSARYDLDSYVTEDGESLNIDSPETMLKLVGKTFGKAMVLKRELAK